MLLNTTRNINLASLTFWSNNWGVLYKFVILNGRIEGYGIAYDRIWNKTIVVNSSFFPISKLLGIEVNKKAE